MKYQAGACLQKHIRKLIGSVLSIFVHAAQTHLLPGCIAAGSLRDKVGPSFEHIADLDKKTVYKLLGIFFCNSVFFQILFQIGIRILIKPSKSKSVQISVKSQYQLI